MLRSTGLIIALLISFFGLAASAAAETDEEAIRALMARSENALNTCDKAAYSADLHPDFTVIYGGGGVALVSREDDATEFAETCEMGMKTEGTMEFDSLTVLGDFAYGTGFFDGTTTVSEEDSFEFSNRWTMIASKENGKWQLRHMHIKSLPLPEDYEDEGAEEGGEGEAGEDAAEGEDGAEDGDQ